MKKLALALLIALAWTGGGYIGSGFINGALRHEFCDNYRNSAWAHSGQRENAFAGALLGPLTIPVWGFLGGWYFDLSGEPTKDCP